MPTTDPRCCSLKLGLFPEAPMPRPKGQSTSVFRNSDQNEKPPRRSTSFARAECGRDNLLYSALRLGNITADLYPQERRSRWKSEFCGIVKDSLSRRFQAVQ